VKTTAQRREERADQQQLAADDAQSRQISLTSSQVTPSAMIVAMTRARLMLLAAVIATRCRASVASVVRKNLANRVLPAPVEHQTLLERLEQAVLVAHRAPAVRLVHLVHLEHPARPA